MFNLFGKPKVQTKPVQHYAKLWADPNHKSGNAEVFKALLDGYSLDVRSADRLSHGRHGDSAIRKVRARFTVLSEYQTAPDGTRYKKYWMPKQERLRIYEMLGEAK